MWRLPIQKSYVVISVSDPAVDVEKSNLDAWRDTLDVKHLVFKEGQTPVEWYMEPIGATSKAAFIEMIHQDKEETYIGRYMAYAYVTKQCLKKVKGLFVGEQELVLSMENGVLSNESLEQLRDPALIMELASYAMELSHLPLV